MKRISPISIRIWRPLTGFIIIIAFPVLVVRLFRSGLTGILPRVDQGEFNLLFLHLMAARFFGRWVNSTRDIALPADGNYILEIEAVDAGSVGDFTFNIASVNQWLKYFM